MLLHVPGTIDQVALVKMFGSNHPPHVTTSLDDVLGEPGGVCGHPAHPAGGCRPAPAGALTGVLPQRVHLQVQSTLLTAALQLVLACCREGMSVLRLSEGGRWKEAVFWQQPRNYWSDNMTSQYQGDIGRTKNFDITYLFPKQQPMVIVWNYTINMQ